MAMQSNEPGASVEIDTHHLIMQGGKYDGEPYTRLPITYLKWMVRANHINAEIAAAELKRRGIKEQPVDVSLHAIDRLSVVALDVYERTSDESEGLVAWMARKGAEAILWDNQNAAGRYVHHGIEWAFNFEGNVPIITTVIRNTRAYGSLGRKRV